MAIPASGPISLSMIQAEFGGTDPISLSEYYRGGAYVGSHNTGIPTSGPIKLSDFYGSYAADLVPDTLDWTNINATNSSGVLASANNANAVVSGITTSIILRAEMSSFYSASSASTGGLENFGTAVTVELAVFVNGVLANSVVMEGNGDALEVSVTNNQLVLFRWSIAGDVGGDGIADTWAFQAGGTITVKNKSSSNTTLGSFTVNGSATD